MAEIAASIVVKLRKMSGQGMMDCKKALEEANGDLEEAMSILRKKGLATLAKRADRETTQGRIVCRVSPDGRKAGMASLCCETDFVARNEDFIAATEKLGDAIWACAADEGPENLLQTKVGSRPFADLLTELVSKTGEKTEIGDYSRLSLSGPGVIGAYVHFNHKVGALVLVETSTDAVADAVKSLAGDFAMHVTAMKPLAVDPQSFDPAVIENERIIAREQVKGKPANIIEKIVEGKIAKFLKDNCFVQQPFVKDDSKSVEQLLNETAKAAGGTARVKRFVRVEIG